MLCIFINTVIILIAFPTFLCLKGNTLPLKIIEKLYKHLKIQLLDFKLKWMWIKSILN